MMPSRAPKGILLWGLFLLLVLLAGVGCEQANVAGNVAGTNGEQVSEGNNTVDDSNGGVTNKTDVKKETLAERVDDMVRGEFRKDVEDAEQGVGETFNKSALQEEASIETVVRLSKKPKKEGNYTGDLESSSTSLETSGGSTNATQSSKKPIEVEQDVDRIIDSHDNEFVLSKPKELAALTLDPLLVQDLTILITASAIVGWFFEATGQPVINGYLVAGSMVGPGGLMLIKELVQVESLAQLGVQLLLFHLGLEFSVKKMRAVGGVALVGGLLEMVLFLAIAAILSGMSEASLTVGLFVGALVSLSSTSVVAKCLEASKTTATRYGQITIGTLILQDCTVGLMFAMLPMLGDSENWDSEEDQVRTVWALLWLLGKLVVMLFSTALIARTVLPHMMRGLARSTSAEMFQMILIGFCLLGAWIVGWLGLSQELGAFIAGAMLSATDQHELAVKSVEGTRNIFTGLFVASIGLVMSPVFLFEHVEVLALGTLTVLVCKTVIIAGVVVLFGIDMGTALMVGINLAQISEFAFVLLSVGQDIGIIGRELYLLLLGVAGMSLLITPGVILVGRKLLNITEINPGDKSPEAQGLTELEILDSPGMDDSVTDRSEDFKVA